MRLKLLVICGLVFISMSVSGYQNLPPLPYSTYGRATLNGADAPVGSWITAWIGGIKYGETRAIEFQGQTMYSLDIPGDDPATGIKEGGLPGEIVVFKISNLTASPTGVWQSGMNMNVDLLATGSLTYLPVLVCNGP